MEESKKHAITLNRKWLPNLIAPKPHNEISIKVLSYNILANGNMNKTEYLYTQLQYTPWSRRLIMLQRYYGIIE